MGKKWVDEMMDKGLIEEIKGLENDQLMDHFADWAIAFEMRIPRDYKETSTADAKENLQWKD